MKFDKESVVVVLIAILFLAGWWYFYAEPQKKAAQENNAELLVPTVSAPASAASGTSASVQTPAAEGKKAPAEKKALFAVKLPELPPVILSNDLASYTIDSASGSVNKIVFSQFKSSADKTSPVVFEQEAAESRSFTLTFPAEWRTISVRKGAVTKDSAAMYRVVSDNLSSLEITQVFTLPQNSYSLKCSYSIKNISRVPVVLSKLVFWNSGVPPLKYLAGDQVYNDPHNIEYCVSSAQKLSSISPSVKQEKFTASEVAEPVDWIGTSNKYFASLLFPGKPFDGGMKLSRIVKPMPDKPSDNYFVPSIGGVYNTVTILPGTTVTYNFSCFTGPKSVEEIKKLPATAIRVLHLSYFSIMEFLARPLVTLLKYLKEFCGSYGIAIILLTLIVRIVFWPVTQKANNSMRKMQKISPKIKELKEKFKDNPQLMNQKMMELYRTEGVNPVGGCLPILLQIPVFLALYSALDAAVELRHVSFLWAADLTKPDLVGPQFLFGYGIHPLVLIMTALMILQQKMTPTAGADPMQQKMMMFMPVIMLVMLYNLPSGLTLYWTVSQVFSILQMKYSQYSAKREEERAAKAQGSKSV